jgi:hypothetical protein
LIRRNAAASDLAHLDRAAIVNLQGGQRDMSFELDSARRYRNYAEELRTIAEKDQYYPTKKTLLQVALDYERMASAMETMAQTKWPPGIPAHRQ